MDRSLYIGTYAGIPVKIHWTFIIIILLIAYISYSEKLDFSESISLSLYVFCLFLCVVLHEYGHALAARKYGVQTKDIILSPIGGLARLNFIPEKPKQEFIIAIAGPMVNLLIATLILIGILLSGSYIIPDEESIAILMHPIGFLQMIFVLNLVLFFFNLIPAFPMDGGRILRALLSMRLDRLKATRIASFIGRVIAVIFIIVGATKQYYALLFIGFFVYVTAYKEYEYLKFKKKKEEELSLFTKSLDPD